MKKLSSKWSGQGLRLRLSLSLVVAALSLAGADAARAEDHEVVVDSTSPNDHTAVIQAALDNHNYTRVILPYRSTGWITGPLFMREPGQELWIKGSGSTPGKLKASTDVAKFKNGTNCLITMSAPRCTINGYSNGVDKTSGVATLEMFKSSYIDTNGYDVFYARHTIYVSQNDSTIKGVTLKNSGGDGIYHWEGSGGYIKDVIVDGANRNGITVIQADSLQIWDSTFKNTSGGAATGTTNGPWAGIDFEPNNETDSLTNIKIRNCTFSHNAGDNILVALKHLRGPGVGSTIGIYFYNTTSEYAGGSGIQVANMATDGPTLGQIYFQDSNISYSTGPGIKIRQYVAGHARITFNRFNMTHCHDSNTYGPIFMLDSSPDWDTIGNVEFVNGCYVNDFGTSHTRILEGVSYRPPGSTETTKWNKIVGQIFYRCNYTPAITPASAKYFGGGNLTEVNVAMTPY
jgi:hypothetical protein